MDNVQWKLLCAKITEKEAMKKITLVSFNQTLGCLRKTPTSLSKFYGDCRMSGWSNETTDNVFTLGVGRKKTPRPSFIFISPSQLSPPTTGDPNRRISSGDNRVLLWYFPPLAMIPQIFARPASFQIPKMTWEGSDSSPDCCTQRTTRISYHILVAHTFQTFHISWLNQ